MSEQPTVLQLANRLASGWPELEDINNAVRELRRLHSQQVMLLDALRMIAGLVSHPEARQKALDAVAAVEKKDE